MAKYAREDRLEAILKRYRIRIEVLERTVQNITVEGASATGPAGGVLSGNYPNPSLVSSVAGDGLIISSNVLNVVGTSNRISVLNDSIDISSSYIGQASITTLGTITTGTWQGSVISRTYLEAGVTKKYSTTIGNGSLTTIPVTHNLNTTAISVEVFETASLETVMPDIIRVNANTVNIKFTTAPSSNFYTVVIIG